MQLGSSIPTAVAFAGVVAFAAWIFGRPGIELERRDPGADRSAVGGETPEAVDLAARARHLRFDGRPADLAGEWPCFRGPARDGVARAERGLLDSWPPGGPKLLWSVELGEGYAGPAVRDGCVFVLDYDRSIQHDSLRCFSLADGKEIWRTSYPVSVKRHHGMSRTVPAVTAMHVIALGPKCHVTCADARTGELRWQIDLVRQFSAKVPPWYAGQCPLVDGDRAIIATGGDALMIAVEVATGEIAWKAPNPRRWEMTHSSVLPVEVGGKRAYVWCASGGVAGVSAEDGSILFDSDAWQIAIATVPTPVDLGGGRLFLSGGYEAGSLFAEVVEEGGGFAFRERKRIPPDVFGATQHTPILYEGRLYGVRPPDGELVCLDLEGEVLWSSGRSKVFGLGPYVIADGKIFALEEGGTLVLVRASPERYEELARARVVDGHECWGPLAIVGGRLLLRDFTRLFCFDVQGRG
ncbi:MAG: outer membrane protein assembly factor BamB family protein [Planctomycetota bacterium]